MAARRQNTFKAKPGSMASISLHSIRLEESTVPLRMLSQRPGKGTGSRNSQAAQQRTQTSLGCEQVHRGDTPEPAAVRQPDCELLTVIHPVRRRLLSATQ